MILKFEKKDDSEIIVYMKSEDDQYIEFSYVDMIKNLIESKAITEVEISTDFTEAEKNSINGMVQHINDVLTESK